MRVKTEVWRCDLCTHEWIIGDKEPTHCPKCRSRKWDKATVYVPTETAKITLDVTAFGDDERVFVETDERVSERSVEYEVEA